MKNLILYISAIMITVLSCNMVVAQEVEIPDSGLYVKEISLTILKQPHKYVDGYAIRYGEEKLLYEHNDTSWYWRGLYCVDPELVMKIKMPTWKLGWPGNDEVMAILKDEEKYKQMMSFKPKKLGKLEE